MFDAGLVLEGGGMRGMYTAGVLDFFIDKGIEFKNCIGVSAGSVQACSYLSKQKRRAYHVVVDNINDKRYASVENLIKTGDFFGKDMHLNIIPNQLNLYDYEAFLKSQTDFYAVATNINTGQAEYLPVRDMKKDIDAIWASSSLPFMAKGVEMNGNTYLDGGVADSIPIKKSMEMGFDKNVIVLTRDIGYRKEQTKMLPLIKVRYKKYPKFVERMKNRYIDYNETVDYINRLEQEGKVFVIRPENPLNIGRIEKNEEKIKEIYKIGYIEAKNKYDSMIKYLYS